MPPRNIILKPESVYEEIDQINLQERPIKKANTIDIRNTISQWYDDASDEIERDLSLGEKPILIHYFLFWILELVQSDRYSKFLYIMVINSRQKLGFILGNKGF